jgi:hypothetical protein
MQEMSKQEVGTSMRQQPIYFLKLVCLHEDVLLVREYYFWS